MTVVVTSCPMNRRSARFFGWHPRHDALRRPSHGSLQLTSELTSELTSGHTPKHKYQQLHQQPPQHPPDRSRSRRHQGFTLLETIVVLALLSVLMVLIWSAISVARRAHEQGQRWERALSQTDAAQTYLRRALMHAQGDRAAAPGRPAPPVFIGSAQRMQFLAPAPALQGNTGPKYHDLSVESDDPSIVSGSSNSDLGARMGRSSHATYWLTLQLSTETVRGTYLPWGTPQRLAGPLSNVAFSYRGTNAAGNDTGWLSKWPWPTRLPRLVRIAATPSDGGVWTTMQIPLVLQSADQQGDAS